jgi:exodeoxyribonuclease VII large subunit
VGERSISALRQARDASQRSWQDVTAGCRQALRQGSQSARALMLEITGQGPQKTLARGFAVVRDAGSGRTLQRASELAPGQVLTIQFHDGEVGAQVSRAGATVKNPET